MSKQNHVIEVGDTVNVLSSDYGADHFSGPAEVIQVAGDELLVFMPTGQEVWFNLQRVKR